MAGTIKVSTDQVDTIASEIESLNNKLRDTLTESQQTIKALSAVWQGDAAQATVAAYEGFATNYFETYYDVIKAYVAFLRQNVSTDYQATENINISLADAFK